MRQASLQRSRRFEKHIVSGAVDTLIESGFVGNGIGTATQGGYHFATSKSGWQEDGVSRILAELGIPGAICLVLAAIQFLLLLRKSRRDLRFSKKTSFLSSTAFRRSRWKPWIVFDFPSKF